MKTQLLFVFKNSYKMLGTGRRKSMGPSSTDFKLEVFFTSVKRDSEAPIDNALVNRQRQNSMVDSNKNLQTTTSSNDVMFV